MLDSLPTSSTDGLTVRHRLPSNPVQTATDQHTRRCHDQLTSMANAARTKSNIEPMGKARIMTREEHAFGLLSEQLRASGPSHWRFDHIDVIALHDAYPDIAGSIAPQAMLLRHVLESRTLTGIMACIGRPANAHACASGLHSLSFPWRPSIVTTLCDRLSNLTRQCDNPEVSAAIDHLQLRSNFSSLTGVSDMMDPCSHPVLALPDSLCEPLILALLGRADIWARLYTATRPEPDATWSESYTAHQRRMAPILAKNALGTVMLRLMGDARGTINNQLLIRLRHRLHPVNAPHTPGAADTPVSRFTYFKCIARMIVMEPATHAALFDQHGPFTPAERRTVLSHMIDEVLENDRDCPTPEVLVQCLRAPPSDCHGFLNDPDIQLHQHRRVRLAV